MSAPGRLQRLDHYPTNGRNRRVSPVAPRPREGPLTEPTAGPQPWPRERVLVPLKQSSAAATTSGLTLQGDWIPLCRKCRGTRAVYTARVRAAGHAAHFRLPRET